VGDAHAAVSRRPPISLCTIVARTHMYTYAAKVWDVSIVQGPFSVAPCQTLTLRFATFASLYGDFTDLRRVADPDAHFRCAHNQSGGGRGRCGSPQCARMAATDPGKSILLLLPPINQWEGAGVLSPQRGRAFDFALAQHLTPCVPVASPCRDSSIAAVTTSPCSTPAEPSRIERLASRRRMHLGGCWLCRHAEGTRAGRMRPAGCGWPQESACILHYISCGFSWWQHKYKLLGCVPRAGQVPLIADQKHGAYPPPSRRLLTLPTVRRGCSIA
jgi:hypothetical protein